MGDGNQALGPLPSGLALGVELAVLRHYIVEVGAGGGDHGPLQQRGPDTGLQLAAFFVHVGGGAADEALSALGQVSAQNEVKLSACTADVLDSCGLCIYLTEEVEVNRVVMDMKLSRAAMVRTSLV